ncbi:hypothetical protein [Acidibrevibacterium fodinaquatile]|uniref:hypothetical protein n=1 Tax=Acidibrevibacterium fodinaquatile TaxID=1969806 RepID=UPI000E0D212C|nr:hypothetical protein [Acidibrevibacterium fodinaquatile]
MSVVDDNLLIWPRPEPSPRMLLWLTRLSWVLPIGAAVFSIGAGICGYRADDKAAAMLGIAGGLASAGGVIFTGWVSRVQDRRLATALAMASLGVDMASKAQFRSMPGGI